MQTVLWRVMPAEAPRIARRCPRCGPSLYASSGRFRLNAQQKNIDVWLIYRCQNCSSTYNLSLFSRVSPEELAAANLYSPLLSNDPALALETACNSALLRRNGAVPVYETEAFAVEGPCLPGEPCFVRISPSFPANIRLDKILSLKTEVSREAIKRLCARKIISADKIAEPARHRLKSEVLLRVEAQFLRPVRDIGGPSYPE